MAVNLSFIGGAGWQFFDDNGVPLSGGKIYTYAAGTTTPQTTYTSRSGAVANANPIILDAAGRTPEQIWSTEGLLYKYVVADSLNVIIRTWDNIGGSVVASNLAQDLADTSDITKGDALVGFKQASGTAAYTGAVASTVHSKLRDVVSTRDFGAVCDGATNDAAALIAALATGKQVFVVTGSYFSLSVAQAQAFVAGLERVSPETDTDFNLPGSEIAISASVDIYNPDAVKIRIVGENVASVGVTTVTYVSGGAKNHSVTYTVTDASNIAVNDYVIIAAATGTGNYRVVEGCFKVTAKAVNDITVKHTMNAAWPSADFTFLSATCYPVKTVLKWPINSAGLRLGGCALGQIRNLIIAGSFDISSGPAADSAGDGLQVGTSPDTFATGLNESEQLNTGAVWAQRVGFVEWQGNGLQVSGGHFYGTVVSACSNGWRGFQAARAGSVEAKFSSAVGNGASGYEAEAEGWMNADASVANGNWQQGYYGIGSGAVLVGRGHAIYNNVGVDIRNYAVGLCDQSYVRNNALYGVYSTGGFIVFGQTASTSTNGTYDVIVTEGGVINATGATSIGTTSSISHDSGAQLIGIDGELIYPQQNYLEYASSNKMVEFAVTSITDLIISFDTAGTGSFTQRLALKSAGTLYPVVDNTADLGRSANRWATVYAATGAINTSDARDKQQVRDLSAAERAVAARIKPLIRAFKFNDAVEQKGSAARVHFGVMAQDVRAAFEAEGLQAEDYGVFCYDEWPEELEVVDQNGRVVQAHRPAGNRYGIRYDELLMFMLSGS